METLPFKCKPLREKVVEVLIDGLRTFNTFSFQCDLDRYVNDILSDLKYFSPCKSCMYNKTCMGLLKNEVYAQTLINFSHSERQFNNLHTQPQNIHNKRLSVITTECESKSINKDEMEQVS